MNTASSRSAFRTVAVLAALAIVTARAAAVGLPDVVDAIDAKIADRLLIHRNAGQPPPPPSPIVHIDINDQSAALFEGRSPGRAEIAAVMGAAAAAGAAAQAYDLLFASNLGAADARLADAARAAGNVYAGMAVRLAGTNAIGPTVRVDDSSEPPPPWRIRVEGDDSGIPQVLGVIPPYRGLRNAARGLGSLNITLDRDGVVRRLPLLFRAPAGHYPSLALAVACGYLGVTPDRITLRPGRSIALAGARVPGREPKDILIPVDRSGAMRLNFVGDWLAFTHFSFGDVWRDATMDPTSLGQWENALGGRIVVVADIATGQAEVRPVAVDPDYPLAGLYATALDNIIGDSFLCDAPAWASSAAEALAVALLAWTALARQRWLWAAAAVVLASFGAAAVAAFGMGRVLRLAEPGIAAGLFAVTAGAWQFVRESREREVTRRAFESYFPPAVVARLVASRERLGGSRRKELTILFSDIVGFTPRTAAEAPERVQQLLNTYLGRMVAIVFQHGGTVDKFIGDGLMVFFNDPDDQPDHPARCVRCALDMQRATRELSADYERAGEPPLTIRIGIHTGPVLVGDLGPPQRLSYTAVGAAVNLAQRLESSAPHGRILVSQATAARLGQEFPVTATGNVRLKGFEEPVPVFLVDDPQVKETRL